MATRRLYWKTWLHKVHVSEDGKVAACGWNMPQNFDGFHGMSGDDTLELRANHAGRFCTRCERTLQ